MKAQNSYKNIFFKMPANHHNSKLGFITLRFIIIIAIILVVASYFFNFSVQDAVENEQTQENFGYISQNLQSLWDNHLSDPANYLWNDVFLGLIWSSFTSNMQNLQNGENTILENSAPTVDFGSLGGAANLGGIISNMEGMQNQLRNVSSIVGKPINESNFINENREKVTTIVNTLKPNTGEPLE